MRESGSLTRALGLVLMTVGASAMADTTYTGTATYSAHRELLPLTNGGAAVHITNQLVGTISPSESGGFIFGDCAGLAYLSPEGELNIESICSLRDSETDGFTLRIQSNLESGSGEIIGGSGTWEGAQGTVEVRRTWVSGDRGSLEYELTVERR